MKTTSKNPPKTQLRAPTLAELQNVISAVIDGRATELQAALAETWIDVSTKDLSARDRMAIYKDGWFLRLEESLAEDFPRVRAFYNDAVWETLVRAYLRDWPSRSFTLARAGDAFPNFLRQREHSRVWIADLASLEKSLYKALGASDVDVWDVAELQSYDESQAAELSFKLQPSVTLIQSDWNIVELNDADSPLKVATYIAVYRDGFTPTTRELEPREHAFLTRLREGATLGELADEFQNSNWLEWLTEAASEGLIAPQFK